MATSTQERARTRLGEGTSVRGWVIGTLAVAVLALAVGWAIGFYNDAKMPGDNSAEAGFARDMSVHHTQAVEMSLIVRSRTNDSQIRTLATDIMLSQQNQIGRMEGWMTVWEVPLTGSEPPMAWMGHTVDGLMPGMASEEDLASLRSLPVAEMNAKFLELMITHHAAGVEMARAIVDRSDRPEVVALADSMVRTQQAEIDLMNDILDRLEASTEVHDHQD